MKPFAEENLPLVVYMSQANVQNSMVYEEVVCTFSEAQVSLMNNFGRTIWIRWFGIVSKMLGFNVQLAPFRTGGNNSTRDPPSSCGYMAPR